MTASRANEDLDLVHRFLAGDRRAFDELMSAHEDRVFSICLRIMRDREHALDAVQETFVKVFRRADHFTGESAFSTWLYRVAVNTCYDQLRKLKRRHADPLPETNDPIDVSAGDELTAVELRPDLQSALERISDEFRAAVILSDLEGLPLADVAEILGVPVGTVKSRVFRARRQLADELRNLDYPPGRQSDDHA